MVFRAPRLCHVAGDVDRGWRAFPRWPAALGQKVDAWGHMTRVQGGWDNCATERNVGCVNTLYL
eukprot:3166983-Lingulodinium_polyedra.AAC.1